MDGTNDPIHTIVRLGINSPIATLIYSSSIPEPPEFGPHITTDFPAPSLFWLRNIWYALYTMPQTRCQFHSALAESATTESNKSSLRYNYIQSATLTTLNDSISILTIHQIMYRR